MVCIAFLLFIIIRIYWQMSIPKTRKKAHFLFFVNMHKKRWGGGFWELGILTNPKFPGVETKNSEIEKWWKRITRIPPVYICLHSFFVY